MYHEFNPLCSIVGSYCLHLPFHLGTNNTLTVDVRKVLSDLEIVMKLAKSRPVDTRSLETPYSTLSFHEEQLQVLERAASRAQSAKSTRTLSEPTVSKVTESHKDDLSSVAGGGREEADEKQTQGGDNSNSKGILTKTVSYSDQTALLKYNSQTDVNKTPDSVGTGAVRDVNHIDVSWRPQTTPYKLNTRYALQRGQLTVSDLQGNSRAASAATSGSGLCPGSAVSSVEHRKKCYIPGPHSIDPENAYSVSHGPHTAVVTLMGDPEAPRYSAISTGICHSSAWYHIRGRYPTVSKPYPPKRSQRRIHFNNNIKSQSRASINLCPDRKQSMVSVSPFPAHSTVHG